MRTVLLIEHDERRRQLDNKLRAIAVIFDFVNPAIALGRVIDQRRLLNLDEVESGQWVRP